jgi:RIO kinase 2
MKHLHTCRHGGTYKVLKNLLKHKLLHHDSSKCEFATLDNALLCVTWNRAQLIFTSISGLIISSYVHLDDGFRLTYLGYDFLAIKTMVNRGVFMAVGRQIGVGKESGIFLILLLRAYFFSVFECWRYSMGFSNGFVCFL